MAYVITDDIGNILALPPAQPFNFEGIVPGTCLIYNLAYVDGLTGATVGGNVDNLMGCFSLSNPIAVNRFVGDDCPDNFVSGGDITNLNGLVAEELCVTDGVADLVDVQLSNAVGNNSAWIITNEDQMIIDIPQGFPIDLEGRTVGKSFLYHVSYDGTISNMAIGSTINMIEGNFAFSNALIITKVDCSTTAEVARESISRTLNDFSLYPNPANSAITVSADQPNSEISTVEIYDTFGQVVENFRLTQDAVIDLSSYPVGYYVIKVITDSGSSYTKSFMKI